MNETPYTAPVFPQNDKVSLAWAMAEPKLERLHDEFLGAWRRALSAVIPADIELDFLGMGCKSYAQFVKDAAAFSDIHVYEVEALQSLCAWSLDPGFVRAAVDHMFGGSGRARLADLPPRRGSSAIEEGVRRRLVEALATAYESAWQAQHPLRLNPLRQEALLSSLRLTAGSDHVVHARFAAKIQAQVFPFEFCLPLRALEVLVPSTQLGAVAPAESASRFDVPAAGSMASGSVALEDASVNIEAVLGDIDLTVAQLISLSIGQFLPLRKNDEVALEVDGVCIATGQSGVRGGRHAVKVKVATPTQAVPKAEDFQPMTSPLASSPTEPPEPITTTGSSSADITAPTDHPSTAGIHEPEQLH